MAAVMKNEGEKVSSWLIMGFILFAMVITLYPFMYIFSMSISEPHYVITKSVWLYPKGFSLAAYNRIFENPEIWTAYANSVFYTVAGTLLNITMTILAAYPLSRSSFVARKPIMLGLVFTMYFTGGMIPLYLLVLDLGLYDTRWALLLPTAVDTFQIIVTIQFFKSISESLHESAKLDGASEFSIMARIVTPLSAPVIALLALSYGVGHWNRFWDALLYLPSVKLQPVALYLTNVLLQNSDSVLKGVDDETSRAVYAVQIKYVLIILVIIPVVCVYPFLQKYFAKGALLGSVKE